MTWAESYEASPCYERRPRLPNRRLRLSRASYAIAGFSILSRPAAKKTGREEGAVAPRAVSLTSEGQILPLPPTGGEGEGGTGCCQDAIREIGLMQVGTLPGQTPNSENNRGW